MPFLPNREDEPTFVDPHFAKPRSRAHVPSPSLVADEIRPPCGSLCGGAFSRSPSVKCSSVRFRANFSEDALYVRKTVCLASISWGTTPERLSFGRHAAAYKALPVHTGCRIRKLQVESYVWIWSKTHMNKNRRPFIYPSSRLPSHLQSNRKSFADGFVQELHHTRPGHRRVCHLRTQASRRSRIFVSCGEKKIQRTNDTRRLYRHHQRGDWRSTIQAYEVDRRAGSRRGRAHSHRGHASPQRTTARTIKITGATMSPWNLGEGGAPQTSWRGGAVLVVAGGGDPIDRVWSAHHTYHAHVTSAADARQETPRNDLMSFH